jgi:gamma-glutamylcyclotransferase
MVRLLLRLSGLFARSWTLSWCLYRLRGIRLIGPPGVSIWYFAYGANMHDSAFRGWRGMHPSEWRPGRVRGYRLRFNLEGHLRGKGAPANLSTDAGARSGGFSTRSPAVTSFA